MGEQETPTEAVTADGRALYSLPVEPQLYANFERQRRESNIYWDESLGGWAVLDFEGCELVECDEATYARWDRPDLVSDEELAAIHRLHGGSRTLLLVQGAEHFRLHGGLSLALTRQVRRMRPRVERLAGRYAAALHDGDDFGAVFSDPFPIAAMTAVMGLSWIDDEERLRMTRQFTSDINGATTTNDRSSLEFLRGIEASEALSAMLRPEVEQLITAGDGNLCGEIFRIGREIFDDWSVDDVVVQCRLLYFAGTSSLAHLLRNQLFVLASHRDLWRRLADSRALIPTFVEESLRVIPPVQARGRVATRDTILHGQRIRRGEHLFLLNGAANRDPAQFECPASIDLDRPPRRHLAFNAGPRACPGTPTARMESVAALNALLDRFTEVGLHPDFPQPLFTGRMNFGYLPLHLCLESKERAS